ncbi:unnamed protein product, partial [Mesorhabditis spiculigera]
AAKDAWVWHRITSVAPGNALVWEKYKRGLPVPYTIYPCLDATRVHVKEANNPDGFYHANWIRPPNSDQQYILAQSPNQTNSEDFWAMVFQERVTCIMLIRHAQEKEDWKAYYPAEEGETKCLGRYEVVNVATGKFNFRLGKNWEVAARHLLVTKDDGGEPLEVTHLHVLNWEKYDCPRVWHELSELLVYLRDVKSVRTMLVHDEPFTGRSDTVVLLATMIDHMDTLGERTDLEAMKRGTFERLCLGRAYAIGSLAQFIFCCGVMQLYFWERYGQVPDNHVDYPRL